MATKKGKQSTRKKQSTKKRESNAKTDLDKRWGILLFALGLFFVVLAFIKGENLWQKMHTNVLFGGLGIGGWLLGPMLIYWAVLVGLGKPVFTSVIKGVLLLIALSGAALVFSKANFNDMKFGEVMKTAMETGETRFGGGILGVILGWTLLVLTGRPVANIIIVIIFIVVVMVLTQVTPADVVRFIKGFWDNRPEPTEEDLEDRQRKRQDKQELKDYSLRQKRLENAVLHQKRRDKRKLVDVDIDLGPQGMQSTPGLAENDEVKIGPGGTFGMNPTDNAKPDILPFDPFSEKELNKGTPEFDHRLFKKAQNVTDENMLFVEPEPEPEFDLFANKGGAGFAAEPKVMANPAFAAANGAQATQDEVPWETAPMAEETQVHKAGIPVEIDEEAQLKKAGKKLYEQQVSVFNGEETVISSPSVDEMIDKAAAVKQDVSAKQVGIYAAPTSLRYNVPPLALLEPAAIENNEGAREEMKKTADLLVSTLESFGVKTRILDVSRGPSVTRYEVQPQAGVKISKITSLADDIALNLAAAGVRIEAPIPGKPAVGIEVPNRVKAAVNVGGMLEAASFRNANTPLPIALGKNIAGEVVIADLTKMPHLLIAGSTGSGKSVCVNATIMSFLYKSSPEDVRLLLIDPKVVELAEYNGIPHLLMPVVTEPRKAAAALGSAVAEMERRYHLFAENNVREIKTYNKRASKTDGLEKMPHIAIVIDELADLMMTSGKEVEDYICRIAQKARAAGMHLIIATQRPSVDVITGLIKANVPSRIAFAVSSQVDSRTILDSGGAEKLLGMGDMLFMPVGANKPVRVQGTYVKDKEISDVLNFIKGQGTAQYDDEMMNEMERRASSDKAGGESGDDSIFNDETFVAAVEIALENGTVSTSFLQRRLRLGYARAGRMMDEMERLGIVSEPEGSKPRNVLINRQMWQEMSMNAAD